MSAFTLANHDMSYEYLKEIERTLPDDGRTRFVYIAPVLDDVNTRCYRVVKIGQSADPFMREAQLNWRHYDGVIKHEVFAMYAFNRFGAREIERDTHLYLGDYRTNGEYFALDVHSICSAIETCVQSYKGSRAAIWGRKV